ncbi:hypothetical protein KKB44_02665 [Candidatus Micrarchaeota archaeon]|nr:hypothetical protein [Candidatus Micrarchaeota archaeon]
MVDMGKVKIKKKVYNFEIKSRYQSLKHYKIKERPPLEKLKDAFRKLLTPKKEEKKEVTTAPPGGFNFAVFGAAILVAIIILGIGWLYLITQFQSHAGAFQPPVEKPFIENVILSGDILSSGQRGATDYTAAVLINYNTYNLNNYSITLTPYKEKLPSEIYVLNSEKVEATTYSDFIRELRANLAKKNMMLNDITIKQLETIPEGAIVIVPSGVVPKELLGFDSSITMDKLAERGVVVIYIGQSFTKMLDGTLAVSTPQDTVKHLPVSFDELTNIGSEENFSLYQPLYRVGGIGWASSMVYGSVSIVKKGDGAFVFLPQTLDGGWRGDYETAAYDVARIVFEIPWAEAVGEPKTYQFTNQTNAISYFFTEPFEPESTSVRVDFTGHSSASNFPIEEIKYIHLVKTVNSDLYIENGAKVVPTNITNDPVRMNAEMNEPSPGQPNMYLVFVDQNGTEVQTFPQGNVNIQADRSFDVLVYVGQGEYIVKLIDDESKAYARTYMHVVSIEIDYKGISRQKDSVYLFDITMDNRPITLSELSVTVDDGKYGTYEFTDVSSIQIDLEEYTGGSSLPEGKHTFTFTSAGLNTNVPVDHIPPQDIFRDPFFWIVIILTVAIVGLGVFFARQEQIYFSLDIPDFPPIARTKIPLSPDVILSLFNKVNENYRWEFTPLTTAEIKNAFKDIFYKGKPIYITDYNIEYLLEDLKKRGSVGEALEYYGLTVWEERSKHSLTYLAILRNLRDICVNNAVPFTGLDESKEADSIITVVGQQMFLHFFEQKVDMKQFMSTMLHTINKGITIVIFQNGIDKDTFVKILDSSPTIAPLILKMESESKSLLFYTVDELEQMIKEFKGM